VVVVLVLQAQAVLKGLQEIIQFFHQLQAQAGVVVVGPSFRAVYRVAVAVAVIEMALLGLERLIKVMQVEQVAQTLVLVHQAAVVVVQVQLESLACWVAQVVAMVVLALLHL
jgi:hypothetical protein